MPPSVRGSLTDAFARSSSARVACSVPAQSVEFSADGSRFAAVFADRIAIHDGSTEAQVPQPLSVWTLWSCVLYSDAACVSTECRVRLLHG